MVSSKSYPAIFAVLATAVLLTSGTAGVAFAATPTTTDVQDDDTDGEEVIEEFREQIESLETVQFTRTQEATYDNETYQTTVDVVADVDDSQKRVEMANTTSVWGEDNTVTTYNEQRNTVSEYEVSGTQLLPRVQGYANDTMIDYEYLGTETVDGEETYVLEGVRSLGAQTDVDGEASAMVYLDTETYFPVKVVTETNAEEFEHSSTATYDNVTLNEEIPDSTFELDLPDDVEDLRENTLPDISRYDSYESVVSNADMSVPAADLTDEYSFESGVVVQDDDYHSVTLTYTDGDDQISVVTRADPVTSFDHGESDMFESVDVGDTTGYLYSSDDFVSLYVEGDQPYTVHGEVDEDTVTDVAAALLGQ